MFFQFDIENNKHNVKSLIFILLFRLSKYFTRNLLLKIVGFPIRLIYIFVSEFIYHFELKDTTEVGEGLKIYHLARSTVIGPNVIIGKNVSIRQNTTIGAKKFSTGGSEPIIGDNVEIGPNVVIIGPIRIGHNSEIGAGSVVVKDIPDYAVVVGNPAKIIKYLNV